MDTRALGIAVVELGGGRRRAEDAIDHAVGLSECCGPGQIVDGGHPLAVVHARTEDDVARAERQLRKAITISDEMPSASPTVLRRIDEADL